ncbi:MAG: hypothetical protein WHT06_07780 [Desulfobacterales bacterium]
MEISGDGAAFFFPGEKAAGGVAPPFGAEYRTFRILFKARLL